MIQVLDASVAVKWFFTNEPHVEEAGEILLELGRAPDLFAVPDFFFIELAAVLLKRSGNDALFARTALKTLYKLGIRTIPTQGESLGEAIKIASKQNISVYDALYLVIAKLCSGRWLTSDERAYAKLGSLRKQAKLLQSA